MTKADIIPVQLRLGTYIINVFDHLIFYAITYNIMFIYNIFDCFT